MIISQEIQERAKTLTLPTLLWKIKSDSFANYNVKFIKFWMFRAFYFFQI